MRPIRAIGVVVIVLAGCRPDPLVEDVAVVEATEQGKDSFLAGLSMNKVRETVAQEAGYRVAFWTDGALFQLPSLIDLYIDMTGFADWESPEASVRIKASCPTVGGARQIFENEFWRADLKRYDPATRRALIVIPHVVGTDSKHESANTLGKHELTVTAETGTPKRTATGTCLIEVTPYPRSR